jgi:hypothetical protein
MAGPTLSKLRPLLQSQKPTEEEMLNQYLASKGISMGNASDAVAAAQNPEPTNVPVDADQAFAQRVKAATPAITQKAKGSGAKETAQTDGLKKALNISTEATFAKPETLDPTLQYLRSLPELQDLRKSQATMQDLLAMEAQSQKPQLDLTPLMALADHVNKGGDMAKTYKAPKNDSFSKVLAYGDKIQDNQRDIAKTLIDAVKSTKSGQVQQQLLDQITSKYINSFQDPNATQRAGTKPRAPRLLTDNAIKVIGHGQSALDQVNSLISSVEAKPELMGTGKGALADVTNFLGTTMGSDKIEEMQQLQRDFKLLQQTVGKGMEEGVLRKEDEIKYNRLLGNVGNDPKVALRNLKEVQAMVKRDVANHLANHRKAGYDTSQFSDMEKSFSTAPAAQPAVKPKKPTLGQDQFLKLSPDEQEAYLKEHGA